MQTDQWRPGPGGGGAVWFGRLTREKGADLVADAARSAGLTALFVGAGPLEAELRARPGVEVIGWQAPDAVWALLTPDPVAVGRLTPGHLAPALVTAHCASGICTAASAGSRSVPRAKRSMLRCPPAGSSVSR